MTPKYRLLSTEELQTFEKEFIEYLVVNGLTGEDWEQLKKEDKTKTEQIVALFSDVVFEGILRKIKYLDFKAEKSLKSFQCHRESITLIGIDLPNDSPHNFLDVKDFNELKNNSSFPPKVYSKNKKYTHESRELELFNMLENGCEISEGELFKSIALAL